jgi:hypothetical protein
MERMQAAFAGVLLLAAGAPGSWSAHLQRTPAAEVRGRGLRANVSSRPGSGEVRPAFIRAEPICPLTMAISLPTFV